MGTICSSFFDKIINYKNYFVCKYCNKRKRRIRQSADYVKLHGCNTCRLKRKYNYKNKNCLLPREDRGSLEEKIYERRKTLITPRTRGRYYQDEFLDVEI